LPARPFSPEVGAEPFEPLVSSRPTVGGALRAAAVDFYHQSWRLAPLNAVLSIVLAIVLLLAVFVNPVLIVLLVLLGPLAASLMHCAVWLAQNDELRFADALAGLRLHWWRGLLLGMALLGVLWLGFVAMQFYGTERWLFAVFVADVLALFVVLQLLLWPRAVHERDRPLRRVAGDALADFLSRPVATLGFALAVLVVNVVGLAAGVMPFLPLTVAYSFLAAAHFALPRSPLRDPPLD
jgi:hypothetical protein